MNKKDKVKLYGEVLTPLSLVNDMLDTLPYEVWTNPNLKWLDPCTGQGTFVSVIVKRLMKGLETFQSDDKLRYAHIMEKMVYSCELQERNVIEYINNFNNFNLKDNKLNIFNGSYLSEEFDRHLGYWGVDKFDIIVMNPPYNDASGSRGNGILWDKFVVKTLNQLVEGGYLVAVHPPQWRIAKGKQIHIKKLLQEKQITYLEIHNMKDGIKTFGVQTAYDFYCLHNVPNTMFTKIKCMDGTIERVDISKMEFIPNGMYNEFMKLVANEDNEKINIICDSSYHNQRPHISKELIDDFKYPVIKYTFKDGSYTLAYSNTSQKGHFEIPKVIWSSGGASTPIIDEMGEFGLTEWACGIVDKPKNLPFIQKAMSHPDFIKLMLNVDGIYQHRYKNNVIATFRKDFWKEFI